MQSVLQRFADSIPAKPYCTNKFSDGTRILPREAALRRKYVQPQIRARQIGWLIFDIDRQGAAIAYEQENLPVPTLTVINPSNAHAHLLYQLAAPVSTTDKSSKRAIAYLESIERAYKHELGSDPAYSGLLTKNPLHESWLVSANDVQYELSMLAEYVDLTKCNHAQELASAGGRNSTVFETVRKIAYKIARTYETFDEFSREILAQCFELNHAFAERLPDREIQTIAKSITEWVWRRKNDLLISADAVNAIKTAAESICAEMTAREVCKFAQKEVAKRSGYSADTVQRFLQHCAT